MSKLSEAPSRGYTDLHDHIAALEKSGDAGLGQRPLHDTSAVYFTKDPDTGVQNVGNYRGRVKSRRRLGMNPPLELRITVSVARHNIL